MALKNIVILFIFLVSLSVSIDAFAQKKSKKKKSNEEATTTEKVVSQEDRRKAEMYHAEAEKYYILDDFAKAFVVYQKSLEIDPYNDAAFYRISQIYFKGNEIEKAIFNIRKAIELNESNKYYYLFLADIYSKQSNFTQAAATYEIMLTKCDKVDEYLFELAAIYIYQENYENALVIYDRIEEKFGINEQVIAQKQKLYLKQSNLDMAISEGQKLIKAYPGDSRYVLMLADILISNNQSEKAIPYLEGLVDSSDENNPRALLMLAEVFRKSGDTEKSNIYLNKAFGVSELDIEPKIQVLAGFIQQLPNQELDELSLNLSAKIIEAHPGDPRSYEISGDINNRLARDEEALDSYKKAIELGASNYNTWQNVLQLEVKMEDFKAAIADGEKALELFPNQAGICWFLGTSYLMEKDYEASADVLERGKKLSVANEELKSFFNAQLGDTYNNLEKHKKSDEAYEAALAYDPNNDHVLNNYSYFLSLRKEKLDLAKKMSTKLITRNPDNSTYLDTHAWVLYVREEYTDAKYYIEKAVNGNDISGTIIEHYGDILFKLGDVESAVKQWQKAKGMDETSELIDKKIADQKLYE